jgi:alpha-D-ribose 1-methylphosphonate 5-phosphate C-P lyase
VEDITKAAAHPAGRHAVPLLVLLVWMRHVTRDDWLVVSNETWARRVGNPLRKHRAATALEELGMVTVRREGNQSLQFKLAAQFDPNSEVNKYRKKSGKQKPDTSRFDTPEIREGDALIASFAGRESR